MTGGVALSTSSPTYLNAKIRYDLEPDYDFLYIFATSAVRGPDDYVFLGERTGSSGGQFEDVWVDLTSLAGEPGVKVSFDLVSDESVSSDEGYGGVHVDDVRLVTPASSLIGIDPITTYDWTQYRFGDVYAGNDWAFVNSGHQAAPSIQTPIYDWQSGFYENNVYSYFMRNAPVDLGPSGMAFMNYWATYTTEKNADFIGSVSNQSHSGQHGTWNWNGDLLSGDSGGWVQRVSPVTGRLGAQTAKFGFGFISNESRAFWAGRIDDLEFRSVEGTWADDADAAYAGLDGTSMAAPYVSGIAGLMLSVRPTLTPAQLKTILMNTVDKKTALAGLCASGGRVNANTAVRQARGGVKVLARWNGKPLPGASVRSTLCQPLGRVQTATTR